MNNVKCFVCFFANFFHILVIAKQIPKHSQFQGLPNPASYKIHLFLPQNPCAPVEQTCQRKI